LFSKNVFILIDDKQKVSSTSSLSLKKSEFEKKQDEDGVVENLDDYDDDKQLRFDMEALNLGSENKSTNPSIKTATTVKSVINQESLSTRTTPSNASKLSLKSSSKNKKRIDVLEEYKKRSSDKISLNLVVVGK